MSIHVASQTLIRGPATHFLTVGTGPVHAVSERREATPRLPKCYHAKERRL